MTMASRETGGYCVKIIEVSSGEKCTTVNLGLAMTKCYRNRLHLFSLLLRFWLERGKRESEQSTLSNHQMASLNQGKSACKTLLTRGMSGATKTLD